MRIVIGLACTDQVAWPGHAGLPLVCQTILTGPKFMENLCQVVGIEQIDQNSHLSKVLQVVMKLKWKTFNGVQAGT